MDTATAIRDKDLQIKAKLRITNIVTTNGDFRSIAHHCGQTVSGVTTIVEEAHRQHLRNCRA